MSTSNLIAGIAMSACFSAYADRTEYAFRWNPAEGGPPSAELAAQKLGIKAGRPKKLEVRYLTVRQPSGLPGDGYRAIARERTEDDGLESMYKVRGPESKEARAVLSKWSCPLSGPKLKSKFEVDVNWALDDEKKKNATPTPKTAISFSCSVETSAGAAFPKTAELSPKSCVNSVRRLKSKDDWKVEEWTLPTGKRIIEVSYSVKEGTLKHQEVFQKRVNTLLSAGALPLADSKTLLGSTCPT